MSKEKTKPGEKIDYAWCGIRLLTAREAARCSTEEAMAYYRARFAETPDGIERSTFWTEVSSHHLRLSSQALATSARAQGVVVVALAVELLCLLIPLLLL